MQSLNKIFLCLCFSVFFAYAHAQVVDTTLANEILLKTDSIRRATPTEKNPAFLETDSIKLQNPRTRTPRGAAIRSAILPGWGQAYNKKLWKVPIVWAFLGTTGVLFADNLVWYKRFEYAYKIAYNIQQGKDSLGSPSYNKIFPQIRRTYFNESGSGVEYINNMQSQRDDYRKNRDYAALYFVIFWGLNVIEATVDAHLSHFDISPDLSFHIEPGYSEMAGTNGLSLVLKIK